MGGLRWGWELTFKGDFFFLWLNECLAREFVYRQQRTQGAGLMDLLAGFGGSFCCQPPGDLVCKA